MKAIRVHGVGGPEVLKYEEVQTPKPAEGQVLVKVEAIGVNYIDVYHRTGQYKAELPFTPGSEASGIVSEVEPGERGFKVGERVAFSGVSGAYAEFVVVPSQRLVALPAGVKPKQAAAAMLQGMTAHYLATSTFSLKPGDACLIHAAAGGVGLLLVQVAKMKGARVLGTVSTEEKAKRAREAGADEVILYTREDFAEAVKKLTHGAGVQVVYDSVGESTFGKGFNCLAPRGMMVLFGQSSGPVGAFDPQLLNQKGSLFLTRPSLGHYTATRPELLQRAEEVLGWIGTGKLKLHIAAEFPLKDAAEAHRQLESRKTSGKLLLIP